MTLEFTKMNGAGNDFVLLDNRDGSIELSREQVAQICDRQRGVGADGLMLLIENESGSADWSWQFYNSDGSDAEMCGNGARCFARYIQKTAGANDGMSFETVAGVIKASFDGERVTVNLTPPEDLRLNEPINLSSGATEVHSLNTGVPHAVVFVPDADHAMVCELGREIRFHEHFAPKGTNVNFAQVLEPGKIRVRTYERGVEGETLACGTGVSAAAMIASRVHGFPSPVQVRVQGGDTLEVSFDDQNEEFSNVNLSGPGDFVFSGKIEL